MVRGDGLPATALTAPARQGGAALILFSILLVLVIGSILLPRLTRHGESAAASARTAEALATARAALIAYAVTSQERKAGEIGALPCPDSSPSVGEEGRADTGGDCGLLHASQIGRLPWRSLGLPPLRDGSGECLWYAVSGMHKEDTAAAMRNTDTRGLLEARGPDGLPPAGGVSPADRAVAIVIAPGRALGAQDRTRAPDVGGVDPVPSCGGNYGAENYLDCLDSGEGVVCNTLPSPQPDGLSTFVAGQEGEAASAGSGPVNDRLAIVSREDLEQALRRRPDLPGILQGGAGSGSLLDEVAKCLGAYLQANGTLPWAAPVDLADYRAGGAYNDQVDRLAGRLPKVVDNSDAAWDLVEPCLKSVSEEIERLWRHWKDHLFYAVADRFKPGGSGGACAGSDCLTVNGNGPYAAIVVFAGEPLASQSRNAPPTDPDDKATVSNYLEGRNAVHITAGGPDGHEDYEHAPPGDTFNDALLCIEPGGNEVPCAP